MKFGIIKERKNPLDQRVVFSPKVLLELKHLYPKLDIKVESAENRVFTDEEYRNLGFDVVNEISDCTIFFGVNEVPVDSLIENKTYFFFLHNIKKQPYNRELLLELLKKNIDFYDLETLVVSHNQTLIGFRKYAEFVGTYNAIRAFGIKFELFKLPKAGTLSVKNELIAHLKRLVLPPLKFVVSGTGAVGSGVQEVLESIKIKKVSTQDYLNKNYTQSVYTQIDVDDYFKPKDGIILDSNDFFNRPQDYISDFEKFTKVSDIYIIADFHAEESPKILTREMLQASNCKIKVVADISCNTNKSIACIVRHSTTNEPFYGYLAIENKEVDIFHPAAIVVMAVDDLSCELPKEASEDFGDMFLKQIIPAFFNGDKDEILQRAKITEKGELTARFSYLKDYVDGK